MNQSYYVYILRCADHTLYTGITNDPARRIEAHNAGKGAKYTRGRAPVQLAYLEACADRAEASRRERAIKALAREKKEALILSATAGAEGTAVSQTLAKQTPEAPQ